MERTNADERAPYRTVHPLGGKPGTNPQDPKFSKISKIQFFDNVYLYLITKNLGDEFKGGYR